MDNTQLTLQQQAAALQTGMQTIKPIQSGANNMMNMANLNVLGAGQYDYITAGFDGFMNRSIDVQQAPTLDNIIPQNQSQQINYDQSPVGGSLGDTIRVGNINIDGVVGRISVYDDNNAELLRIGNLDD